MKKHFIAQIVAPFTCEYEGKRYRSEDKFNSGVNGCAQCICVNGQVSCDETKCQILVDPPESSTIPTILPKQPEANPPTKPAPPQIPIVPPQGNEKGPDLGYYASHLTDVNMNSEKGPSEPMQYMPEQYQYLQAQVGQPGLRGPPGMMEIFILYR